MIKEMDILVTGGTGMVGTALRNIAPDATYVSSDEFDLRSISDTERMFDLCRPKYVIHLAARVGGVSANTEFVGDFFLDNIRMNTNVLELSRKFCVQKTLSLLSTCVYPDDASYPLSVDQIHNGRPHSSNFGYAYAKRMLDVQSRAYRQQYGCSFITAIPNNLYGENDNFDLQNGHVIPAIIRKIYEANLSGSDVTLWGDGSSLREFTYSNDLAKILFFLIENYNDQHPINIGCPNEVSIKYIAEKIAKTLKFKGNIVWDESKPSGQYRKPSSNDALLKLGWSSEEYSDLEFGIEKTCDWFALNYPNVRGA